MYVYQGNGQPICVNGMNEVKKWANIIKEVQREINTHNITFLESQDPILGITNKTTDGDTRHGVAGMATIDKHRNYYVLLGNLDKLFVGSEEQRYEQMKYVVKHEVRHCDCRYNHKNPPFRFHDVYYYDVGYCPPVPMPFFFEDIVDIIKNKPLLDIFSQCISEFRNMKLYFAGLV